MARATRAMATVTKRAMEMAARAIATAMIVKDKGSKRDGNSDKEGEGKGGKRDGNSDKEVEGKGRKMDGDGNKEGNGKGGKGDGNSN